MTHSSAEERTRHNVGSCTGQKLLLDTLLVSVRDDTLHFRAPTAIRILRSVFVPFVISDLSIHDGLLIRDTP